MVWVRSRVHVLLLALVGGAVARRAQLLPAVARPERPPLTGPPASGVRSPFWTRAAVPLLAAGRRVRWPERILPWRRRPRWSPRGASQPARGVPGRPGSLWAQPSGAAEGVGLDSLEEKPWADEELDEDYAEEVVEEEANEGAEGGGSDGAEQKDMVSPFATGVASGKPKLDLTLENVEVVLDELRPYLQSDGGDCKVVELDGPVLILEMQGSCSTCSSSAITLKMGIERTMLDRFPDISSVEAIMPGAKVPDEDGVNEILESISPFLSVSGSTVELVEIDLGEGAGATPYICVGMTGPAQSNAALKAEVHRRIKFIYGQANIEVIGEDDDGEYQ